jgi:hypothetical protein
MTPQRRDEEEKTMVTEYAVYAYKVTMTEERGSVSYWFSSMAEEIGRFSTQAQARRKALAHTNRHWIGTEVVKLLYDNDDNEIDENILESFTP